MAENIDAFLYFGSGGDESRRPPSGVVEGESSDQTATQDLGSFNWPMELKTYKFGFEMDSNWAQDDHKSADKNKIKHRPKLSPLTVTKSFDMASPRLLDAVQKASVFDTVKLIHRRAGGAKGHQIFFTAEMKIVVVQALDWDAGADGILTETVQLDFCSIDVEYIPQQSKGGDDTTNKVSGSAVVSFPKSDSDYRRSFDAPDSSVSGDGDLDEKKRRLDASIKEINKKMALLGMKV